jgi:hypothetical protein
MKRKVFLGRARKNHARRRSRPAICAHIAHPSQSFGCIWAFCVHKNLMDLQRKVISLILLEKSADSS